MDIHVTTLIYEISDFLFLDPFPFFELSRDTFEDRIEIKVEERKYRADGVRSHNSTVRTRTKK